MKEKILTRYLKGWVTEEQLERYAALGAITEEEAAEIRAAKKGE